MGVFMEHVAVLQSQAEKFLYRYKRYRYYYDFLERLYRYTIVPGLRVLHIGCADGFILRVIDPSYAVGIDDNSFQTLFSAKNGYLIEDFSLLDASVFDYVIVSASALKQAEDIQGFIRKIKTISDAHTRIIFEYNIARMLPILPADIRHFCFLEELEIITEKNELLVSLGIPYIADFFNYGLSRLPLIKKACLMRLFITRFKQSNTQEFSVSVIIPCKNEAGTIQRAIQHMPAMGRFTEIILIDGHSKDGTVAMMQRVQTDYPEKNITWFVQSARGKKNAVEEGFLRARGDMVMILDGDITVEPEELPKFYHALASGRGECINGVRLVYPMDRQAMPLLNWFVNWSFGILISYLIGQSVKDTLCGTKVFFKKDLGMLEESKRFFGNFDPFGDFDILCGAAYRHLKIVDIPVHFCKG